MNQKILRSIPSPTLRFERKLIRKHGGFLLAADEVGRGSCAGPVSCGVVVVELGSPPLRGVKDSKLISANKRENAVERIENWAIGSAVGHASAAEVDEFGLTGALRLAVNRATTQVGLALSVVLLDGNVDWFSPLGCNSGLQGTPPVYTKIKADLSCTAVAAASIIAKVNRDRLMTTYAETHPNYGWENNKGYATKAHMNALREFGFSDEHRRSWKYQI